MAEAPRRIAALVVRPPWCDEVFVAGAGPQGGEFYLPYTLIRDRFALYGVELHTIELRRDDEIAFELGAHADVLAHFRSHVEPVRANFRHEQAYLSDFIHRQGKMGYRPAAWCRNYKYHCVPRWPLNHFRAPRIPPGARILIFHGVVNPPDALVGERHNNWRHMLPAPWIAEHWVE